MIRRIRSFIFVASGLSGGFSGVVGSFFPPLPDLLGPGEAHEKIVLLPPRGVRIDHEVQASAFNLPQQLRALDEVRLVLRHGAVVDACLLGDLTERKAIHETTLLVQVIDSIEDLAVRVREVDDRALAGGLEDFVSGFVVLGVAITASSPPESSTILLLRCSSQAWVSMSPSKFPHSCAPCETTSESKQNSWRFSSNTTRRTAVRFLKAACQALMRSVWSSPACSESRRREKARLWAATRPS